MADGAEVEKEEQQEEPETPVQEDEDSTTGPPPVTDPASDTNRVAGPGATMELVPTETVGPGAQLALPGGPGIQVSGQGSRDLPGSRQLPRESDPRRYEHYYPRRKTRDGYDLQPQRYARAEYKEAPSYRVPDPRRMDPDPIPSKQPEDEPVPGGDKVSEDDLYDYGLADQDPDEIIHPLPSYQSLRSQQAPSNKATGQQQPVFGSGTIQPPAISSLGGDRVSASALPEIGPTGRDYRAQYSSAGVLSRVPKRSDGTGAGGQLGLRAPPVAPYAMVKGRLVPTPTTVAANLSEGQGSSPTPRDPQEALTEIPVVNGPLVDIGCALHHERFAGEMDAVLRKARLSNVQHMILPCMGLRDWEPLVELVDQYAPELLCTVGVHPLNVTNGTRSLVKQLSGIIQEHRRSIVAVGECGLDFKTGELANRDTQVRVFLKHLELAKEMDLPVLCSETYAHTWFMDAMQDASMSGDRVCIIRFTGTAAELKRYVDYGCYFGVSAWIQEDERELFRLIASSVPLDRLMLLSDSPSRHPSGDHTRLMEPCLLPFVAKDAAQWYGVRVDEMAAATTQNACRFFSLQSKGLITDSLETAPMDTFLDWLE